MFSLLAPYTVYACSTCRCNQCDVVKAAVNFFFLSQHSFRSVFKWVIILVKFSDFNQNLCNTIYYSSGITCKVNN